MANHVQNPDLIRPNEVGGREKKRQISIEIGGVSLFEPVDIAIWIFVILFFTCSAAIGGGNFKSAILGALAVVFIMFFVGVTIEVIIDALRDVKGLGTLVGFITNGPEALCLLVGLIGGDVLFAASTPLGSNFMNPVMLISAALITGMFFTTLKTRPGYTLACILLTASFAGGFFFIDKADYWYWLIPALLVSGFLFIKRPDEAAVDEEEEGGVSKSLFFPALVLLIAAGYLLDPVVSYTAEHSRAPKGVIGFFVLSALTSWPEFKSCLSLFRRQRPLAAVLNITVSNITNIWLALLGVFLYKVFF